MRLTAERLSLLAALAIAAALQIPSLGLGFLSDDYGIVRQVHERGLLTSLEICFTQSYLDWVLDFYRPISAALFTFEVVVFETRPLGYHVVTLLFMLGTGALVFDMARRLQPGRAWCAGLIALLWMTLPAHLETLSWTIAGQQEEVAAFFVALTIWLLLRASPWSVLAALLACGSKESAFGLAPFLPLIAMLHAGSNRRPVIVLGWVNAAVIVLAFFGRNLILGGFKLPYAQVEGDTPELAEVMLSRLPDLPFACLAAAPWLVLFAAVTLPTAIFVAARKDRRGVVKECIPVLAAAGILAPLLTLNLESIKGFSGNEVRAFAPGMVAVAILAARAATNIPRQVVLVLLIGASCASGWMATQAHAGFQERSDAAEQAVSGLRAIEGDRLLVAGLPPGLQWALPSTELPPFRTPGRLAYPLRAGTLGTADVLPVRPLGQSARIAVVWEKGVMLIPEDRLPVTNAKLVFSIIQAEGPGQGAYRLETRNLPLRALPSLRLTCKPGSVRKDCHILLLVTLPEGGRRGHVIDYPVSTTGQVIVPLIDVPEYPIGVVHSLLVFGASTVEPGPDFSGRMTIAAPLPGSLLTTADAGREFDIRGVPPETRALKVTLFTAGGAGFPVIVPGQTFNFAALTAEGHPFFWYVLENGLKLGADTIYLMVEALSDPENIGSLVARAPLAHYRIKLEH